MVDIYGGTSTSGLANFNNTLARLAEQNRQAPYEAERLNAMKRTGELAGINLDEEKRKQQGLIQAQNLQPIPGETPEQRLMRQRRILYDTGNYDSSTHLQGLADQEKKDREYVGNRLSDLWTKSGKDKPTFIKMVEQEMPGKGQYASELNFKNGKITTNYYDKNHKLIGQKLVYDSGQTDIWGDTSGKPPKTYKPDKPDKPHIYTSKEIDEQLYPLVTTTTKDKNGKLIPEYDQEKLAVLQQKYHNYLKQGMSSPDAMNKVKSEYFPSGQDMNLRWPNISTTNPPNQNPSVFNQPNWKPPGPPTIEKIIGKYKGNDVIDLGNGKWKVMQ